jgi:hypothetical protein
MADVENRRMPVRTSRVEMDAPYEGWTATVRVNVPMQQYEKLFARQTRYEAMAEVVQGWNFVDDDGEPIPITPEGIGANVGLDLFKMLLEKVDEAIAAPLAPRS